MNHTADAPAVPGLVSVIIPAHNARTTIARALNSVAAQTYRPLEVIIVDDASVDGTGDIAREYREIDLQVVRLTQQSGASAARNKGIACSRGEFVAFLDADDEWLPEKTTRQVEALNADGSLSFVSCEPAVIAPGDEARGNIHHGRERANGSDAWKVLLRTACIATPSVIARRSALRLSGVFDPALAVAEDQDLWIRLALAGPVRHIDDVLVRVHAQAGSLTDTARGQTKSTALPMILKHVSRLRGRLNWCERNRILAERYASAGRSAYQNGQALSALRLLAASALRGYRPAATLWYLLSASFPARIAKRVLGVVRIAPDDMRAVVLSEQTSPLVTVVVIADKSAEGNAARTDTFHDRLESVLDVCARCGCVPVCVVDGAFLADEKCVATLRARLAAGKADVGATWMPAGTRDSAIGTSVPYSTAYEAVSNLTIRIYEKLGKRPRVYMAGQHRFTPSLIKLLEALEYEVDLSVLPFARFGPKRADFSNHGNGPYRFGSRLQMLELPVTRGLYGLLAPLGRALAPALPCGALQETPRRSLLAIAGILTAGTLSPAILTAAEIKSLLRQCMAEGQRIFCLHVSISQAPTRIEIKSAGGITPNRPASALEEILRFFTRDLSGRPASISEVRRLAMSDGDAAKLQGVSQ